MQKAMGVIAALVLVAGNAAAQQAPKTLVAVFAHTDDEVSASPILARYAREGARVHLIIVTDGAQGGSRTDIPRGPELVRARAEEARCAATALGLQQPILLGFPDGKLGDYVSDPSLLYRLTPRLHSELQSLRPDAIVTWGPDGGVGHPDHRLVSDIVTQLVRAGAPGIPERLFYAYIPVESIRAMNPARGEPPLLIPQEKYFTVRVSFTPADLGAASRSMACHRTQYTDEIMQRVGPQMGRVWNGVVAFVPFFPTTAGTDLFLPAR